MTFYDVDIYGANFAGSAHGMRTLVDSMKAFEETINPQNWRNSPTCGECKLSGVYDSKVSDSPLWHTFLVRTEVIQAVELCGNFSWTKKKGMGRDIPRNWLVEQVAAGKELWFTLTFYEI